MRRSLENNNKSINLLKLKNIFESIYNIKNNIACNLFDIYSYGSENVDKPFDKIETLSCGINHQIGARSLLDFNIVNNYSFKIDDFIDIVLKNIKIIIVIIYILLKMTILLEKILHKNYF